MLSIKEIDNNQNKFQHTVMHEFAHLIYGARDVFMKENKELNISDFEEAKNYRFNLSEYIITKKSFDAKSSNSIMNKNAFFSAGDILLWSAKNTKNLKENEEKVRTFAQNYQAQNLEYEYREYFNQLSKADTKLEKLQLVRNRYESNISNYSTLCKEDLFILEFYKLFEKEYKSNNLQEQIENEVSKTIEKFDSSKLENPNTDKLDSFKDNKLIYLTSGEKTDCALCLPDGNFVLLENTHKNLSKVDVSKFYMFKQYENNVVKIGIDFKNRNMVESVEVYPKLTSIKFNNNAKEDFSK